jgi:hypothetical protein
MTAPLVSPLPPMLQLLVHLIVDGFPGDQIYREAIELLPPSLPKGVRRRQELVQDLERLLAIVQAIVEQREGGRRRTLKGVEGQGPCAGTPEDSPL